MQEDCTFHANFFGKNVTFEKNCPLEVNSYFAFGECVRLLVTILKP